MNKWLQLVEHLTCLNFHNEVVCRVKCNNISYSKQKLKKKKKKKKKERKKEKMRQKKCLYS